MSGEPDHQQAWLAEAARTLPAFPLIRAVSYFADVAPPTRFFSTTRIGESGPEVLKQPQRPVTDPTSGE